MGDAEGGVSDELARRSRAVRDAADMEVDTCGRLQVLGGEMKGMSSEAFVVDSLAFEGPKSGHYRGYTVRASHLKYPHKGDALVEIFKDGNLHRSFLFPSYKIWNIAAHFHDIVDGEIEKSASGYAMDASDGLGGFTRIMFV